MIQSFEKDIFSKSKIYWNTDINRKDLKKINIIVKNNICSSNFFVKQNNGMELNSNNFKLIFKSKKFILKRWSKKMKVSEIKDVLNLISWLNKKKIETPILQKFTNNEKIIKYKNEFWSYFIYVDGNHFNGEIKEMKNLVRFIGNFTNKLKKYPKKNIKKKYKYFTKEDENILKFMKKNLFRLDKFFSKKHSKQIENYLPEIINLFEKLKKFNLKNTEKKVIHMDIHPHNILTKNRNVKALLDIDSCVIGEIEYALSYAALKICKQATIFNKKNLKQIKINHLFFKELRKTYKLNNSKESNFYYYAISEVIRRLIEMFKLTIKKKNKKWNHVIPIQLGHLEECKILFLDPKKNLILKNIANKS